VDEVAVCCVAVILIDSGSGAGMTVFLIIIAGVGFEVLVSVIWFLT
jgi:hypothetical protein